MGTMAAFTPVKWTKSQNAQSELTQIAMKVSKEHVIGRIAGLTMLKVPASVTDTANAVAFVASDRSPAS